MLCVCLRFIRLKLTFRFRPALLVDSILAGKTTVKAASAAFELEYAGPPQRTARAQASLQILSLVVAFDHVLHSDDFMCFIHALDACIADIQTLRDEKRAEHAETERRMLDLVLQLVLQWKRTTL